jgi:hypothetical protein
MRLHILLTLFSRKEFVTMRDQARHTILVPNGPSQIILQVVGFQYQYQSAHDLRNDQQRRNRHVYELQTETGISGD